jgi:hypothetical protein
LVWVVGDGGSAGWGGKEVREEFGFWGNRAWEVGEDGSGWGRRGNNGDRCFSDGWWEVLYEDVGKWDMLNDL